MTRSRRRSRISRRLGSPLRRPPVFVEASLREHALESLSGPGSTFSESRTWRTRTGSPTPPRFRRPYESAAISSIRTAPPRSPRDRSRAYHVPAPGVRHRIARVDAARGRLLLLTPFAARRPRRRMRRGNAGFVAAREGASRSLRLGPRSRRRDRDARARDPESNRAVFVFAARSRRSRVGRMGGGSRGRREHASGRAGSAPSRRRELIREAAASHVGQLAERESTGWASFVTRASRRARHEGERVARSDVGARG